ncbi:MAG: hypothetical protein ACLF0P_14135 [Thermoanaerobaculia bacterium]
MKRWEAWSVHASTLLVGGTGLVYAVMRYFLRPSDPYAVVNHPLQPTFQHLHVLTAPLLVFAAGLIWREHVWKHFRNGVRSGRPSGLWLLATIAPMVVSGYLIQTTVTDGWRTAWIAVHLATSALWLSAYSGHALAVARKRVRTARSARQQRESGFQAGSPADRGGGFRPVAGPEARS